MDKIAKAIIGATVAAAAALGTALVDNGITATEYVLVVSAAIIGFFGVWGVPNKA